MSIRTNEPPHDESAIRGVRALDKALLDACTRISHSIQRRTGLTNFFIAKCFGLITAGFAVMDLIADYSVPRTADDYAGGPRLLNDGIALAYVAYVFIVRPERLEQQYFAQPGALPMSYLASREPCRWRPLLLSLAMFFPLFFMTVGRPLWTVLRSTEPVWALLSVYFMAVVPLPPGQDRVEERFSLLNGVTGRVAKETH